VRRYLVLLARRHVDASVLASSCNFLRHGYVETGKKGRKRSGRREEGRGKRCTKSGNQRGAQGVERVILGEYALTIRLSPGTSQIKWAVHISGVALYSLSKGKPWRRRRNWDLPDFLCNQDKSRHGHQCVVGSMGKMTAPPLAARRTPLPLSYLPLIHRNRLLGLSPPHGSESSCCT